MADIDDIIDTIIAEALGEGDEGMRRVGETIINRGKIRGLTPAEVVRQPRQYTGYEAPGAAAVAAQKDPAIRERVKSVWEEALLPGDPTNGADHYFNPSIVQPSWAKSMESRGQFGGHAYYASPQALRLGTSLSTTPKEAPVPQNRPESRTGPAFDAAYDSTIGAMRMLKEPIFSQGMATGDSAPVPRQQSASLAARRSSTSSATPQGSASDRVRASKTRPYENVQVIELVPTNGGIGQGPTTRPVQSVPVKSFPQTSLAKAPPQTTIERALPTSSQLAAATGFRKPSTTPGITDATALPPLEGFDVANKDQSRLPPNQGFNAVGQMPGFDEIASLLGPQPKKVAPVPQQRLAAVASPVSPVPSIRNPVMGLSLAGGPALTGRQPLSAFNPGSRSSGNSSTPSAPDMGTIAGRTQVIDGALKNIFNRPSQPGDRKYNPNTQDWD